MKRINSETKARLKKVSAKTVSILAVGILYYLFASITGIGIPCIIKKITGNFCPGCGISRMFMALFKGDLRAAANYNLLVITLLLPSLFFVSRDIIIYIKTGSRNFDIPKQIFVVIVFIMIIAFWIMRNTERFSWLAP